MRDIRLSSQSLECDGEESTHVDAVELAIVRHGRARRVGPACVGGVEYHVGQIVDGHVQVT